MNYENLEKLLINFLANCAKKANCKTFIVGVSGGIDSAVVSALCKRVKGVKTFGLLMPSNLSNPTNLIDAKMHCKEFKIDYEVIEISKILDNFSFLNTDKIRFGNIAARIRMILLYDFSKKMQGCVVGTSNLSERMLGYGTIYGDLACAFNPIGEIFKSEIFEFAKFLGIKKEIIDKAPSADLYENQSDEMEFGFSYKEIDEVLINLYENRSDLDQFNKELVNFVKKRISLNKFKNHMPKIAKIRSFI